jgi:hypothetical protein
MKALLVAVLFAPVIAFAQSVDVKGMEGGDEGTTTIQIKKTKNVDDKTLTSAQPLWEVSEGTSELESEPATMQKEARTAWNKACADWKKEFRADNKENKVINISCGKPVCGGEVGNKVCTSTATYKIKTKMN